MDRKALFFDIDGTLYSEIDKRVPESAAAALKQARKNGHLVFINTGRTYSQTRNIRSAVEQDGLLCGCGTYIVLGDKVIYNRVVPEEQRLRIKKNMVNYNIEGILEGVKGCCMRNHLIKTPFTEHLKKFLINEGADYPQGFEDDSFEFSKFCVMDNEESDTQSFFKELEGFEIIDRRGGFYECVPEGHSKATAIACTLEQFGIPLEDAWVFGDSTNDLTMFQYAPNGVVMGKHDPSLEPYATFITKTVEEDGVEFVLKHFGII